MASGIFRLPYFAAVAMMAGASVGMSQAMPIGLDPLSVAMAPQQQRQRRAQPSLAPSTPRKYRSRWKAQRRPKHRNLNHVSKRVRRRHRRARAA